MAQNSKSRPISLHPLRFEEAITDLLKVKPMPKPPKKQAKARPKLQVQGARKTK